MGKTFVSLNTPLVFPVVIIPHRLLLPQLLPHWFALASPVRAVLLVLGTVEALWEASFPPFLWHLLAADSSCQLERDWFIQMLSAEAAPLKSFRFFHPISLFPYFPLRQRSLWCSPRKELNAAVGEGK